MNIKVEEIYQQLMTKYNLSYKKVNDIVISQFQTVVNVIRSAEQNKVETFKTIHLTYIGKFTPSKKRLTTLIRKNVFKGKSDKNITE